ncbi:MAG: Fic family protein [Saprospiraceae bacterium]
MSPLAMLPPGDLESKSVLRKAAVAHRYLAELKGVAASIPNQEILIDTLALQEARESSAIENIISTLSEVYQSNVQSNSYPNAAAKEIHAYVKALRKGFELVRQHDLLTNNYIIEIQSIIEENQAGFRKLPGTGLINERTGEVIYTPPQDYDTIVSMMENLQHFINDPQFYDADPLVKMAIIHHQFESIHPFYDGNGRTGRIINILYLIQQHLLDIPILYISRYIIRHKADYYRLLQDVREKNLWEEWILYMLDAVIETATDTIRVIKAMHEAMDLYRNILQTMAPKIYSQDLLYNLFRHPYTKIEYMMKDLSMSRNTIMRYLETLQKLDLLEKRKIGRDNYYLNKALLSLLIEPKE